MKNFSDLTQQETLALALTLEEEDSRTHNDLAEAMREIYPGTARIFAAMAEKNKDIGHLGSGGPAPPMEPCRPSGVSVRTGNHPQSSCHFCFQCRPIFLLLTHARFILFSWL
jgi:hypothetical protein